MKYNKINKQIYIYLMRESSHWYCVSPILSLNQQFKQKVMGKQVKFTYIATPAISNAEASLKLLIL